MPIGWNIGTMGTPTHSRDSGGGGGCGIDFFNHPEQMDYPELIDGPTETIQPEYRYPEPVVYGSGDATVTGNPRRDVKDTNGKLPMRHMQWLAICSMRGLRGVFQFAFKKYGNVDSWKYRDDDSVDRYKDSLLRHWGDWMAGEEIDKESGLPLLAHIAWNVLTLLQFYLQDEAAKKV